MKTFFALIIALFACGNNLLVFSAAAADGSSGSTGTGSTSGGSSGSGSSGQSQTQPQQQQAGQQQAQDGGDKQGDSFAEAVVGGLVLASGLFVLA